MTGDGDGDGVSRRTAWPPTGALQARAAYYLRPSFSYSSYRATMRRVRRAGWGVGGGGGTGGGGGGIPASRPSKYPLLLGCGTIITSTFRRLLLLPKLRSSRTRKKLPITRRRTTVVQIHQAHSTNSRTASTASSYRRGSRAALLLVERLFNAFAFTCH